MKTWKKYGAGLAAAAGLTPALWAQFPAAPAPAAVVPAGSVVAAPAAPPHTLWSFLGLSGPQMATCKEKFCATQLGQLTNNSLKPVSALSGGLISGCCPPYSAGDLLKPPGSAEGAAARIKADEADAKARREAVRYLGTVDCHYWPEAQDALANALRADRNECVRYEAALALGGGCCCTKVTIEALSIAVSGSTRDGNPSETSDRVRFAAQSALDGCLARLAPTPLPLEAPVKEEERGKEPRGVEPVSPQAKGAGTGAAGPNDYYKRVSSLPAAEVLANARRALAVAAPARPAVAARGTPRGEGGLMGLLNNALNPPPGAADAAGAPTPPEPARLAADPVKAPAPSGDIRPASFQGLPPAAPAAGPAPALLPPVGAVPPVPVPAVVNPGPPTSWQGYTPRTLVDVDRLLVALRTDSSFSQREAAARSLAAADARTNPEVVDALMTAARRDSAPVVRAQCVRTLVALGVGLMRLDGLFQELLHDPDPRVKDVVSEALMRFPTRPVAAN